MNWRGGLLAAFLTAGTALLSSEPSAEKTDWLTDWPTAQRLARQDNKPIFAVMVCKH